MLRKCEKYNCHTKKANDCLAFRAVVPDIAFDLKWNTGGDLDIEVTESNGVVVSRLNRRGECGLLVEDKIRNCPTPDKTFNGLESIIYDRSCAKFPPSVYTATVK